MALSELCDSVTWRCQNCVAAGNDPRSWLETGKGSALSQVNPRRVQFILKIKIIIKMTPQNNNKQNRNKKQTNKTTTTTTTTTTHTHTQQKTPQQHKNYNNKKHGINIHNFFIKRRPLSLPHTHTHTHTHARTHARTHTQIYWRQLGAGFYGFDGCLSVSRKILFVCLFLSFFVFLFLNGRLYYDIMMAKT